jgi:hypothetical protein
MSPADETNKQTKKKKDCDVKNSKMAEGFNHQSRSVRHSITMKGLE